MNNLYKALIAVLILSSCTKEEPIADYLIDIQLEPLIVVEGIFTNQLKNHQIKLSYSQSASELQNEPQMISGAQLSIFSADETFLLTETSTGIYETEEVQGVIGENYTLRIAFGGKVFEGSDEMKPVLNHEKITYVEEAEGLYSIPFRPHQFGYDKPNRFDLNVFVPDSLWDDNNPENQAVKSRTFTYYTHPFFEPNGVFEFVATDHKLFSSNNYYMRQLKYSISDDYYSFLRALFSETEWKGGLLDSKTGEIPTNMKNVQDENEKSIIGFFAACGVDVLLYKYPVEE